MIRPALVVVEDAPVEPAHLLTIGELCQHLRVSRSKLERDVTGGLPCIDVGRHDARRRVKRSLRFDLNEVMDWYRRLR